MTFKAMTFATKPKLHESCTLSRKTDEQAIECNNVEDPGLNKIKIKTCLLVIKCVMPLCIFSWMGYFERKPFSAKRRRQYSQASLSFPLL